MALCSLFSFPAVQAQEPAKSQSKADIEQIVKDYIMAHPEVLMESVKQYQLRERAAQQERSKNAAVAKQAELNFDPTSPASKPVAAKAGEQVTVVEFFDYRCGYCKRMSPALLKMVAEHPNVRLVFKEFPILGPESLVAAKAALAAERQGKYMKFHQAMMASTTVTEASIEQVAKEVGLDVAKLKADMQSPEIAAIIVKNTELASAIDVSATPSFVIGGEVVQGALDEDGFKRLITKAQTPAKN